MNLTVNLLGDGQVQVIIDAVVNGTAFRDALYYPNAVAHNVAVVAGTDITAAQLRVDNWSKAAVTQVVQVHVLRPIPTVVTPTPDGCVTWGGYWDYVALGDLTAIPADAVYAASLDGSGAYRTVVAAPASLLFQHWPEGWNPSSWPSF